MNRKKRKEEFAALIGIDWADEKHDIALQVTLSDQVEQYQIKHTPEALSSWKRELQERFAGQKVAICIEQSRGALIAALSHSEQLVIYPANPSTLSKFREAFYPSGAKDDPVDAKLLLEVLCKHRKHLRPLKLESEDTRKLKYYVEYRRSLVDDKTKFSNRITSLLKLYFPQAIKLFGEKDSKQAYDFLTRWPTLEVLQQSSNAEIREFYKQHRVRVTKVVEQRIQQIREAIPLTKDQALIESTQQMVVATITQIDTLVRAIKNMDLEIEKLFKSHQDAKIFNTLPGAGVVYAPRLLVAFGTDKDRYESADKLSAFSGVSPIVDRSGKSKVTTWRRLCPKFQRQTLVEFARHSTKKSIWAKAYYDYLTKEKHKSTNTALRILAFKWVRVIFRCWKNNSTYSELTYLRALQRSRSPLLAFIAKDALVLQ